MNEEITIDVSRRYGRTFANIQSAKEVLAKGNYTCIAILCPTTERAERLVVDYFDGYLTHIEKPKTDGPIILRVSLPNGATRK